MRQHADQLPHLCCNHKLQQRMQIALYPKAHGSCDKILSRTILSACLGERPRETAALCFSHYRSAKLGSGLKCSVLLGPTGLALGIMNNLLIDSDQIAPLRSHYIISRCQKDDSEMLGILTSHTRMSAFLAWPLKKNRLTHVGGMYR